MPTPHSAAQWVRAFGRFPSLYWFPVAAAYGALVLPWSVLGQLGIMPSPPGIASHLGHAHEMLFGFALAVVAGYTLTPSRRRHAAVLLAIWLGARAASLGWPSSWAAAALNAAFAGGLAASVAPMYLRAAKWRNRAVAFVLMGLAAAVLAFHASALAGSGGTESRALLEAVLLLSALMFFMGGRILAPAIAGHIRRKATPLRHVVQARLEGATLLCLATAMLCFALPTTIAPALAGAGLLIAAASTVVRVSRWRIWQCWDKPELLALLAGYAWLVIGWVLVAGAVLGSRPPNAALHAITTGALGTLTWSVMLRTQLFRTRRGTDALPWARLAVPAIAVATALRLSVIGVAPQWPLLVAAALWSLCFAALCAVLIFLAGTPHTPTAQVTAPKSQA